jgi:alpha-D-xyloside xylohydrolase
MDWPADPKVRDLSDQWMFGPALMPCPVYEYKARSRSVYFPEGGWYDFYSGAYIAGGQSLTVDAPYSRMPLYVRAGSIVPVGPDMEWCDQKPMDKLRLYVYAGRDASFTLYEDDGLSYDYEKGAFSTIPISWDDAGRTLTIGECSGVYEGMLNERTFTVVLVDKSNPVGFSPEAPGLEVQYSGASVSVKL